MVDTSVPGFESFSENSSFIKNHVTPAFNIMLGDEASKRIISVLRTQKGKAMLNALRNKLDTMEAIQTLVTRSTIAALADAYQDGAFDFIALIGDDGDGEKVMGYVTFSTYADLQDNPVICINNMGTNPLDKNRGVGESLLNHIKAHAKGLGASITSLVPVEVLPFFMKRGFTVKGMYMPDEGENLEVQGKAGYMGIEFGDAPTGDMPLMTLNNDEWERIFTHNIH
jgi:N-acetylglutamate synthase-like GNAT family acetyltransferase